ncbi:hypothetical protein [Thalassotalea agarivorans]|uniref:Uncharacterized protein n=1 Tax=Thalassotalea agarivorans TaxID=349064 RepID=A0A1I0D879_THASX|nr:hypothetical protein [Thalassotalea agarivorans]SET28410.1 hypothetical protein SAMN05660429_01412 [Thalassotalea agarivorans]
MPLKMILTLMLFTLFSPEKEDVNHYPFFTNLEPFFKTNLSSDIYPGDKYSDTCPDGSDFMALAKHFEEGSIVYTATCFYEDEKVMIEHVWIDEEKHAEYLVDINLDKIGLYRTRLSAQHMAVAYFCDNKTSYVEIYKNSGELYAVFYDSKRRFSDISYLIEKAEFWFFANNSENVVNKNYPIVLDKCTSNLSDKRLIEYNSWTWKYKGS